VGLERAVEWCEKNRYEYHVGGQVYRGWNSGGQLTSLAAGKPESWATGVVHMFLVRLAGLLSVSIQRRLREKYDATGRLGLLHIGDPHFCSAPQAHRKRP
jgi:hypothetical protein